MQAVITYIIERQEIYIFNTSWRSILRNNQGSKVSAFCCHQNCNKATQFPPIYLGLALPSWWFCWAAACTTVLFISIEHNFLFVTLQKRGFASNVPECHLHCRLHHTHFQIISWTFPNMWNYPLQALILSILSLRYTAIAFSRNTGPFKMLSERIYWNHYINRVSSSSFGYDPFFPSIQIRPILPLFFTYRAFSQFKLSTRHGLPYFRSLQQNYDTQREHAVTLSFVLAHTTNSNHFPLMQRRTRNNRRVRSVVEVSREKFVRSFNCYNRERRYFQINSR